MQFSEQLRSLRMTQKDLADKLCISPSTIGMYEQNRRILNVETLNKVSSIFDVSVDYLLGNSTHNEHSQNLICNCFGVNMYGLHNHYPEKQSVDNQPNELTPPITEREQDRIYPKMTLCRTSDIPSLPASTELVTTAKYQLSVQKGATDGISNIYKL